MSCEHKKTFRGADIPRRWGSFQSEVCSDCGMYRARDHHGGIRSPWRPAKDYERDIEPIELD